MEEDKMGSNRLFYKLDELSERWGITENQILQMAASGSLTLSIFWTGYYWEEDTPGKWKPGNHGPLNDWVTLGRIHAIELATNTAPEGQVGIEIHSCFKIDGTKILPILPYSSKLDPKGEHDIKNTVFCPTIQRQALCVMCSEVTRLEKREPEILDLTKDNIITRKREDMLRGQKAIANYLGVSPSTLKNWRATRWHSPPIEKDGPNGMIVAYKPELDRWRETKQKSAREETEKSKRKKR
jgi:hypothetical protein